MEIQHECENNVDTVNTLKKGGTWIHGNHITWIILTRMQKPQINNITIKTCGKR